MAAASPAGMPPHRIVIVGGGTAGWIAAAMLARFGPRGARIELVESDTIGTVGVGEATIPQIQLLLRGLGLDEAKTLAATGGTFKLGIEFVGWGRPGARYMHAFGPVGRGLGVTPFHHLWLRGRAMGAAAPLGRYVATAQAAAAGRFARAAEGGPDLAYAYHIDAGLLAALLRRVAESEGVRRTEGRIVEVRRDGGSGDVASLLLDDGREVAGDLFVDCSGFASLLLGRTLGVPYESWSRWLPCDRALAVPSGRQGPLLPYTRATAGAAGWTWRIPLQHRTGNGHVWSSAHLSDDEAAATLLSGLDAPPLADPRPLRFEAGRRARAWERNVVAIGLAAGFVEPLESTSIHAVQSAVARLLTLFPGHAIEPTLRDDYNRQTAWEAERIRDFIILHYHANARPEPFWRERRETPVPSSLAAKIERFRARAGIVQDADELFTEPGWLQVMIGQGIVPAAWSPLADGLEDVELARFLAGVEGGIAAAVAPMPDHGDTVRRLCPSPAS